MNKAYSNKQTSISSQNHAQRNRVNKTRYDKLGKPMKQTSFIVKKKKKKTKGKPSQKSQKAIHYKKQKFQI